MSVVLLLTVSYSPTPLQGCLSWLLLLLLFCCCIPCLRDCACFVLSCPRGSLQNILDSQGRPTVRVNRIVENAETPLFKSKFYQWDPPKSFDFTAPRSSGIAGVRCGPCSHPDGVATWAVVIPAPVVAVVADDDDGDGDR